MVKMSQHTVHLGQTIHLGQQSFHSKSTHTHAHSRPNAVPGPLHVMVGNSEASWYSNSS